MKEIVRTEAAPAPFQGAPYSQAIISGGFVFVSGQLSLRPDHAEIVGGTIRDILEGRCSEVRSVVEACRSRLYKYH